MEARELDMMMTSEIGMGSGDSASGLHMFTPESPVLTVVVPSNETEITFPDLIPYTPLVHQLGRATSLFN